MTQEEYIQIIQNLDNSYKDNFIIRWHDGKGGKSEPIRGFTATHKINPNIQRVVDKDYVNYLQKTVKVSPHTSHYKNVNRNQPVSTWVSPQQALLLRLKYGDELKYFEQSDGQVRVVWPS